MPLHLDSLSQQAAANHWSALEFLDALTQTELAARTEQDSRRKMRQARFPFHKTLDEFDFAFQPSVNERQIRDLATMRFVAHAEIRLESGKPIWRSPWASVLSCRGCPSYSMPCLI
jgi:DNA replication protein DnaC